MVLYGKKTIALSKKVFVFDKDRARGLVNLATSLPKGIGRLFLPILGVVSTYILIYILLFSGIGIIINKFVGNIDFSSLDINAFMLTTRGILDELKQLSPQEINIINYCFLLFSLGFTVVSFVTMLWIPEIVYGNKNSYKALFLAINKTFKTFTSSILVYIYINFLIIVISLLNTLLMFNPFLYFFVLMLYYYFLVYVVVLLFTYYEQKFITEQI